VGQKSSMPYQFNMLHILPQACIPVDRLPLDVFVSNKIALLRKQERNQQKIVSKETTKKLTAREEMEELALTHSLFMIQEFQFDHVFY